MEGQGNDPGELENRLSLSPNDPKWKDTLSKWADDEEYTVTLTIRQVAPGEFEVMDLKAQGAPSTEEETPTEEAAPAEEPDMPTRNPAIRRMAAKY